MMISDDQDYLTFSQREGKVPLPEPMKPMSLSRKFRVRIARLIADEIQRETYPNNRGVYANIDMQTILADYSCEVRSLYDEPNLHSPGDDKEFVKNTCLNGNYHEVLTLIEFILRHNRGPNSLKGGLLGIFDQPPVVAYCVRYLNECWTIVPRSNIESGKATDQALKIVERDGPKGAKEHLRKAANSINEAKYADSIRESMHAMEAVGRTINPDSNTLGEALNRLQDRGFLKHPAIVQAFKKLYGYTNDEEGLRHSMLNKDSPDVGLDEAMFMFSACAAGAAYLINKRDS